MKWKIVGDKLVTECECKNFMTAIHFVNKIAELAELKNHHPDIFIYSYKKIRIILYTHWKEAITEKDHALAREISGLYETLFR